MTELEPVLQRLGLRQYLEVFVAEGFDTWIALLDIQESDLECLNVKLGHRRKLQRAIAEWRGWGPDQSLGSPLQDGGAPDGQNAERSVQKSGSRREQAASTTTEQKRKYRRHPRPDSNAPDKPASAYVLFSNTIREEVKSEALSFTEIARLVGERWQKLTPVQKESFELHASQLKETYNSKLVEYKRTNVYKEYSQYLVDFRAKHPKINDTKRPKLESNESSASMPSPGNIDGVAQTGGHHRGMSISSLSSAPYLGSSAGLSNAQSHTAGGLSHLSSSILHRSSPPYHSSQSRMDQLSSTSSVSEESSSNRADQGDTISRTASLSLTGESNPAAPPIVAAQHRTSWVDFAASSAYGALPSRRPPQPNSPSATSATSPASTTMTIPSGTMSSDWWRERGQEAGRLPIGGGTAGNSLTIAQLVDSGQIEETGDTASRRALPPLPQLSTAGSQSAYSGLGASLGPEQIHYPPELTRIRERHTHEAKSRSENEAADALAGLGERRSGKTSDWSSRSRQDRHW